MKLISLNTWAGRAGKENLLAFFQKHCDIDIFCLQEVWEGGHDSKPHWGGDIDSQMITNISKVLPEHVMHFYPHWGDWWGLAILIKKNIKVVKVGDIFVWKNKQDSLKINNDKPENHARNLQYITIETKDGLRTILNFHGLWNGQGKEDTDERLLQSDNIIGFVKTLDHPFVLCGDFNLLPETKSLRKFEEAGLRDLVKEFGITSTRSSHYKKPIKFADYTFVSPEIKVNEFKMLPDEVSDHLAMYLDFE